MAEPINPVPYEHQNIFPYLMVDKVTALIKFLELAFGGVQTYQLARNDGSVMHAEMKIGANRIMMGEPNERFGAMPVSIYLYVDDCDKVFENALKAGATLVEEVKTMAHAGERYGCVKDVAGNIWWIASYVEDMTLEESQKRVKEMS